MKLSNKPANNLEPIIRISLGVLFLIDGILQFQPKMFTEAFATDVLAVNLSGQPSVISNLINFGIKLFSANMLLANGFSALIQVIIGVMLILPFLSKYRRIALYASIVWPVIVWIFGEGLGNIFTGTASFYSGAPGSVILYAIIAVYLLYPKKFHLVDLPRAAGVLFILGAILQCLPVFWTTSGIQNIFSIATGDSLNFIASPAEALSNFVSSVPLVGNGVLILLLLFFGFFLLIKPIKPVTLVIALFLFVTWWVGQDFGSIQTFPTDVATDPNSGLVFFIFLIPVFYR